VLETRLGPYGERVCRDDDQYAIQRLLGAGAGEQGEELVPFPPIHLGVRGKRVSARRVQDDGAVEEPPVAGPCPGHRLPDRGHRRRWIPSANQLTLAGAPLAEGNEPGQGAHRIVPLSSELRASEPI